MTTGLAAALEAVLVRQLDAQRSFYGLRPDDMEPEDRMAWLRTNALAAVAEVIETLDEAGWKPWKSKGFGEIDRAAFAHEMSDVILFLLNMLLVAGVTGQELADALETTWAKNEQRQQTGY